MCSVKYGYFCDRPNQSINSSTSDHEIPGIISMKNSLQGMGSHARAVYPTNINSRIGTAKVEQGLEVDT